MQTPTPGQTIDGYTFNGGDPADSANWQPASAAAAPTRQLQPGFRAEGYVFKGGDPADPVSWLPENQSRGVVDTLKDAALEATSAAASGVGSLTEFVAPGNRFAQGVDDFTQSLTAAQTPQTQAAKQDFARELEDAQGIGAEASAVLSYALENPLLALSQAAGSFLIPGTTIKGAGAAAKLLGGGAKAVRRAGTGAGVAVGASLGGGEAAGSAYDLVMQTPDETLDAQDEFRQMLNAGMERTEAKERLAEVAARKAQILPSLVGGAFGAVGVERLLAGAGGYSGGVAARAFKGFASEGAQEAVEEGVTTFEGQRAAAAINPEIDPTKGVAGAATFGALLGGATGAGVAALSKSAQDLENLRDKEAEERITKAASVEEAIQAAEDMAALDSVVPELDAAIAQYASRDIEQAEADPTAMRAAPDVQPLREDETPQQRLEEAAANPVQLDPVAGRLESAALQGSRLLQSPVNQAVTRVRQSIEQRNGVALPAEAEFLQRYNQGTPYDRVATPEELNRAAPVAPSVQPAQSDTLATVRDQPRETTRFRTPQPFNYSTELQGGGVPRTALPVLDRVQSTVNVARRTNTPAAQAFAGQFARNELAPVDVQASLTAQDRAGQEVQNRLTAAASARPAQTAVEQASSRLQTLAQTGFTERQGKLQVQRSPVREVEGALQMGEGRTARLVPREELGPDAPLIKDETGQTKQQLSRAQFDVLNRVAGVFGKDVQLFDGVSEDGFIAESNPNTIYINKQTSIQPTSLVFHEMAHRLQKENREAYDALRDVVLSQATEEDRQAFASYYKPGSEFDADELVADAFGSILAKPETLNTVFQNISKTYGTNKARAIVTRLAAAITRAINRVLATFKTPDYKTVGEFVGKTEQDLVKLKDAVTVAATNYAKQQRSAVVQSAAEPQDTKQVTTSQASGLSRVMFEVAPDPNDTERKAAWDALSPAAKSEVSARVVQELMPEILKKAGVDGEVQPQLGGWMDDTNPSFAVVSKNAKGVVEAAKLAGYALRQEGVMVIQAAAFEKSLPTGLIRITLPSSVDGKDLKQVSDFYKTVRAVDPTNLKGHTTVGQEMLLAVPSDVVKNLAERVARVLPADVEVNSNDAFVAYYDKGDYDYGNLQGAQPETARFANSVRAKADSAVNRSGEQTRAEPDQTQTLKAASQARTSAPRTEQDRVRFSTRRAVQDIKDYARQFEPDFFRTPKSSSVAIEDIVADIAPQIEVQKMPEGFYPKADETFTLDVAGNMAFISRKENAVWVNVGGLEPGVDGARVYQVAGAFAYNNGYTLIGDPEGISEAGKLRRLENMISLALKYGSSDFLKPHNEMLGWKGLLWSGTSDDKLALMLRTSSRIVKEQVPGVENVKFDPDTGEFTDRANRTLGPADFADMAKQARVGKTETERQGMPGSGTVRMAIVFDSLLRRAGVEQPQAAGTVPDASSRRAETLRTGLSGIRASTARDQPQTPEFKRWFGDSKVVDAEGKPLVVYHGASATFNEFKESPVWGDTFFFTARKDFAKRVAKTKRGPVLEAFVALQNPKLIEADEYAGLASLESVNREVNDGVVILDNDGVPYTVVAFEPTQIKSATGNAGTFDPANPDIRFSTAREQAFDVAQPGRVDNIIRKLQDKNVDLKRVQESVKKVSGEISDEANAYQKEELYHGRAAKLSSDFLNFKLTPLLQELRIRKVSLKDFETYLWNRHAEERNIQIAKVNDRFPDNGSGIKTAEAVKYLKGLTPEARKNFEALAARVDAMVAENLQMMVDTGLETQETVNAMKQAYKFYVPLMRAESSSFTGRGQGYSIKGATTKRALGSDKPVDNVLASLVDQREKIISRAEKSRVGKALIGLALQNPNDDFWFVFDPLLNKPERSDAQRVQLRNQLEQMGFDPELAEDISKQPYTEEMGPNNKVVRRPNRRLTEAPNAVAVRINGEDKFVVLNQENERARKIAEALTNMDAPRLEGAMGVLAKASRYFASINTQYNPVFGIINLMRDTQGALINLTSTEIAGEQSRVTRGIAPAARAIYQAALARRSGKVVTGEWADLYERFQNVGGQTGFRDMFDNPTQRTQRQLKALAEPGQWRKLDEKLRQPIFNWLSDYNESLENAVRLSAFKAALDKGLSDDKAASIAKNLTVNFNRKGQIGAQAGAIYAFYNASVQGTARLVEALAGPKGRQIVAGGLLLGAAQPLILALAGFDDEQPPEFVRERNLVIPVPGGGGKYLTVPMPLGLHLIPNVGRIAMEQVMGRTQKNVTESLGELFLVTLGGFNPIGSGTFLQTLAPTVLDPAVALSENKDFAGRPIAREDFSANKPTPGYTRTKDNTIDVLIPVSRALNLLSGGSEFTKGMLSPTPDQIEYLVAQLTGGVGREVSKVVQVAETTVTGEELPIYKRPLLGRLYGDAKTQSAQAGQFYENLRTLHDHKLEVEGRIEAGQDYRAYLAENPEAGIYKMAERVEREVQKLRRNKRLLKERGAGPETIRQIEEAITAKMTRLNEQIKIIRGQAT